jgi:hypothetical protein
MWVFDSEYGKWIPNDDKLTKENYDFYLKELSDVRFYAKCLSGAVYSPLNNLNDIYDVLGKYEPISWYIGTNGSPYTNTLIPSKFPKEISATTSFDYYNKFNEEYGLTLKTLFTPKRLMDDTVNYIYVDLATTEQIITTGDLKNLVIDGITVQDGHRILVKDQISRIVLPSTVLAEDYFLGNYEVVQTLGSTIEYKYYDSSNGIYIYQNKKLVKSTELSDYRKAKRFSVSVKNGNFNLSRQFHLSRLLNGYYPINGEPMEFIEKKNWLIRNKVDYNNLFETNYYDVIKHGTQSYNIDGITYSIPERTISVGEFGIILNTQDGISNIINNKYKVNLRSISQTTQYYWICGDKGVLLKVRKHDFDIQRINLELANNFSIRLMSISFYDDFRGSVVGDLNTIFVTTDKGSNWKRLRVPDFDPYYYNKVLFKYPNKFWVVGNTGIFLEMSEDITGWTAFKKRISRAIDDEDEYLLVDNINDIQYANINNWGLSYSFFTQSISSNKELLFLACDENKIIAYDINNCIDNFDFIYFDLNSDYGDILSISNQKNNTKMYFTGLEYKSGKSGVFSFDLSDLVTLGVGTSYSNTIISGTYANFETEYFPNKIFDYKGEQIVIAGNDAQFYQATYSSVLNLETPDPNFVKRLKSKLLFLDYDVASKLNFFTDAGDYRLPEFGQFSDSYPLLPNGNISFNPLIISATFPSFVTQSEVNWWSYWKDREMTFEYYSQGFLFSESTKVLMSNTFSYSSIQSEVLVSQISISQSDILPLAPTIGENNSSRYNGLTGPSIYDPMSTYDLFIYDYLMIKKVPFSYSVSVGDVMRFSSKYVEGNFIVNKIFTSGSNKFIYMFTNFNENIVTNLKSLTASIVNLNSYKTSDEFVTRFNLHPMSNAYKSYFTERDDVGKIKLDFLKGASAYDGWNFNGNFTSGNSFQIGFSGQISSPTSSLMAFSAGTYSIESPDMENVNNISFTYQFKKAISIGTYSSIVVSGLSGSSWYNISSINIPSLSPTSPLANSFTYSTSFNDSYSKFKFDLKVSPSTGGNTWIQLDDLQLSSNSKLIVSATAYGVYNITYRDIVIEPKFNYYSAYYNLATNVSSSEIPFTMSYTEGFLNFGYKPNYNLLSYLEGLNDYDEVNPRFTADKEYFSLPDYRAIPMPGTGDFGPDYAYIDYNGLTYSSVDPPIPFSTSNKILFGSNLILEWQSIMVNTFVDVHLYENPNDKWPDSEPTSKTEKVLVMKKYYDAFNDFYVIEFNKRLNHNWGNELYWLDIVSRRKLSQISDDLQELNNIQRPIRKKQEIQLDGMALAPNGHDYFQYERELNFKLNTDSYAKVLMSDMETKMALSGVVYSDYKGELALNITRLNERMRIPIQYTGNYLGKLFVFCTQKHGLKDNDGVVLNFSGGNGSSEQLNQNYFGYQTVKVVNEFNFYVNLPYGNDVETGQDSGFVTYVKTDPFLGFEPVDLIDVGVDKRGKTSIELNTDNFELIGSRNYLSNVDFNKLRYRLIDGMNLDVLVTKYPWILEAEISGATIGFDGVELVWYKGIWECGRWFSGRWISGQWISGDWYNGIWDAKTIKDNTLKIEINEKINDENQSIWYNGRWFNGVWNSGLWLNGRWYDGTWNSGTWFKGIWNRGTWKVGEFTGGIWVTGTWENGIFNCDNEPAYWIDGNWNAGDFENGIWYNGNFDSKNGDSRFGVNAYNSRTATWHAGNWIKGEFHSRLNINDDGKEDVSDIHKYSIWRTGNWFSGDFYGGVAYNIDWKTGTWHGGILEDIEVIGLGTDGAGKYYFTLNGIFKFNTGDKFTIIDNQFGQYLSTYGSNETPKTYIVLDTEEIPEEKWTKVFVASIIGLEEGAPDDIAIDTTLRIVSRFKNCNWKSGIWTNGIYENGLWEGGIWYNGIFEATWM